MLRKICPGVNVRPTEVWRGQCGMRQSRSPRNNLKAADAITLRYLKIVGMSLYVKPANVKLFAEGGFMSK
jgi:hypothetical protein